MSIVINDVAPRAHYIATAGQTVFAIPFEWIANGDLKVYVNETPCTFSAPPTGNLQYSTTGEGVSGGGSLTFGAPGRTAGDEVIVFRDTPIARTVDFPTTGVFPVAALNDAFDAMTTMIQQTEVNVQQRTLGMALNDFVQPLNRIPNRPGRAGRLLGFDGNGQPVCLLPGDITGGGGGSGASARWYVATRAGLTLVDPTIAPVVTLMEPSREGEFIWTTGDFAARIAADTQQGIYVVGTVPSSAGAWVRVVPDGVWQVGWFGVIPSGSVGAAQDVAAQAMFALGAIATERPVAYQFEAGVYPFDVQWPKFTYQVGIWGRTAPSDTVIFPRVTSADLTRGFIASENWGANLKDFNIRWNGLGGQEYKYGYSNICTANTTRAGTLQISNVTVSLGDAVDYGFFFDGRLNTVAPVGNRDIFMSNCLTFGAQIASIGGFGVQHLYLTGCNVACGFATVASGTGTLALEIGGSASVFSDIVVVAGGNIAGSLKLDKMTRSDINTGIGLLTVTNTSDVSSTIVRGRNLIGPSITLEHNWDGATCAYDGFEQYSDRASAHLNSTPVAVTGDGTAYKVIFDTLGTTTAGLPSSKCYNTTTGQYVAQKDGYHDICTTLNFNQIGAAHTDAVIEIRTFTAAAALIASYATMINPNAIKRAANGGEISVNISESVYMVAGGAAEVWLTVSGSTKTINLRASTGTNRYCRFSAALH